jgi:uncharacterized protein (TIGR02588 family)
MAAAGDDHGAGSTTTPAEFALGALGAAALLGIILYLLLGSTRDEATLQPEITVELAAARASGGGSWVVPFTATNATEAPAQEVHLAAKLVTRGGREEEGAAVIDFLGGRSSADGGFVFSEDPGTGTLTARVTGFARP